jgi:hypothetical protein
MELDMARRASIRYWLSRGGYCCQHRSQQHPVRSSHCFTACRYGHKWVVLAVVQIQFLFAFGISGR